MTGGGRPWRRGAAGGVLAGLLLLTACGGDTDEASPSTSAPDPGSASVGSDTTAPAGPSTTARPAWEGQPDPCSLLTDEEVRAAVRFDVTRVLPGSSEDDGPTVCTWNNARWGAQGGSVTLTVVPPGQVSAEGLLEPTPVDGVGVASTMGGFPQALGPGTTAAVVDMGDGGFAIGVFTYEVRLPEETEALARAAAGRWATTGATP